MSSDDHIYLGHGVPENHLDSWFRNYVCEDDRQKDAFDRIVNAHKSKRSVIMLGKFGTGKTHLSTAIVKNYLRAGLEARYYTLSALFRSFRSTFEPNSMTESSFFESVSRMPLLATDEINIRSDSDAENRFFQEILDIRYGKNLPTVLTGNLNLQQFVEVVGERIIDRFKEQNAEIVIFDWKSNR